MIYEFPLIETIDDVYPLVRDKEEFILVDKGDYLIINYTHRTPNTFPELSNPKDRVNAILRECRGIAFYPDGRIMSRPFHKFFNMNEKSETDESNVARELQFTLYNMLEKLDGSMVRPIFINGDIKLGTKMGLTDTSENAQSWIKNHQNYYDFLEHMGDDCTPIFEWCSRKNKIVLDYPEDRLVLTAIRDTKNGHYMIYPLMNTIARNFNIDCVKVAPRNESKLMSFVNDAIMEKNIEGYVLRMEEGSRSGHMVKIKCDWYLALHKTKDAISQEKNVLALILNDDADDLLPLIDDVDKQKVLNLQSNVWKAVDDCAHDFDRIINDAKDKQATPKEFALKYAPKTKIPSIAFACFRNRMTTKDAIIDYCVKHCNTKTNVEKIRELLGDHVRFEEIVE